VLYFGFFTSETFSFVGYLLTDLPSKINDFKYFCRQQSFLIWDGWLSFFNWFVFDFKHSFVELRLQPISTFFNEKIKRVAFFVVFLSINNHF